MYRDDKSMKPIDRIVDAVCDVLAEEGVANLSIRKVADKAGASIGLITHHFPSRDAMVLAAVEITWERERRAAQWPRTATRERVLRANEAFLPLDEERRRELSVWLAFWALSQTSVELQALHRRLHRYLRNKHAHWIRELGYSNDRARMLADQLVMTIDGFLIHTLLDKQYWTPARQRAFVEAAVDNIFDGAPIKTGSKECK